MTAMTAHGLATRCGVCRGERAVAGERPAYDLARDPPAAQGGSRCRRMGGQTPLAISPEMAWFAAVEADDVRSVEAMLGGSAGTLTTPAPVAAATESPADADAVASVDSLELLRYGIDGPLAQGTARPRGVCTVADGGRRATERILPATGRRAAAR